MKGIKGFTLLEVIISIALMSILAMAIYKGTADSFELNHSLTQEYDSSLTRLMGLNALKRDINQFYSVQFADPEPEKNKNGKQNDNFNSDRPGGPTNRLQSVDQTPTQFWSKPIRTDGLRRTRFYGTSSKLSFISNGNRRLMKGAKESDFMAVIWEIIADKENNNMFSLIRTVSIDAFQYDEQIDGEKLGDPVVVLDQLSSAKFEYYDLENKEWEAKWDSEESHVKDINRYPGYVRLQLQLGDPLNKANIVPWEGIFHPLINYNKPKEKKDSFESNDR